MWVRFSHQKTVSACWFWQLTSSAFLVISLFSPILLKIFEKLLLLQEQSFPVLRSVFIFILFQRKLVLLKCANSLCICNPLPTRCVWYTKLCQTVLPIRALRWRRLAVKGVLILHVCNLLHLRTHTFMASFWC